MHWIDPAKEMPDVAKTHFHRYGSIRHAWETCNNGVYLIWLALHFGPAEDKQRLGLASGEAMTQLRNALDAHFRSKKTRDGEDPLASAYRDVIADVEIAAGGNGRRTTARPNGLGTSYEGYRADALRVVADLLRTRLDAPC